MNKQLILLVVVVSTVALRGEGFSSSLGLQRCLHPSAFGVVARFEGSALWAADGKKRRRRKQPPAVDPPSSAGPELPSPLGEIEDGEEYEDLEEIDISKIVDVAKFKFDGEISRPGRF